MPVRHTIPLGIGIFLVSPKSLKMVLFTYKFMFSHKSYLLSSMLSYHNSLNKTQIAYVSAFKI